MKSGSPDMYGYDGRALKAMARIELHPGCDLWMQGARYGYITRTNSHKQRVYVRLDKVRAREYSLAPERVKVID